jgi:hypothetical protein
MVQIPRSPGARVAPTTETGRRAKTFEEAGFAGDVITSIGQTISGIAIQRRDSLRAAKVNDATNKIRSLDNELELEALKTAVLPEQFSGMKQKLLDKRKKAINGILGKEKDSAVVSLVNRDAESKALNLERKLDREELKKEVEYGRSVITDRWIAAQEDFAQAVDPVEKERIIRDLDSINAQGLASGYISPRDIQNFQQTLKKEQQRQDALDQRRLAVVRALNNEIPLDSKNKEDIQSVNEIYNDLINSQDENLIEKGISLSVNTGIVPKSLSSGINAQVTNGNVEQKITASAIINRMVKTNPRLLESFNSKTLTQAGMINKAVEAGLSGTQAVEFAESTITKNLSFERQERQRSFSRENTPKLREERINDFKGRLQDEPGFDLFAKDPEIPDSLIGEYNFLVEQIYLNEGADIDVASSKAQEIIESNWTITNVGKKRYQKFAPERLYSTGRDSKWIQDQLFTLVQKQRLEPLGKKQFKSTISLDVDPDSINSNFPNYFVLEEDEGGQFNFVLDANNQPLKFIPDFSKTKDYQDLKKEREKLKKEKITREAFAEERQKKFGDFDIPVNFGGF